MRIGLSGSGDGAIGLEFRQVLYFFYIAKKNKVTKLFFLFSSFINLISDSESEWEKDPDVQAILAKKASGYMKSILLFFLQKLHVFMCFK